MTPTPKSPDATAPQRGHPAPCGSPAGALASPTSEGAVRGAGGGRAARPGRAAGSSDLDSIWNCGRSWPVAVAPVTARPDQLGCPPEVVNTPSQDPRGGRTRRDNRCRSPNWGLREREARRWLDDAERGHHPDAAPPAPATPDRRSHQSCRLLTIPRGYAPPRSPSGAANSRQPSGTQTVNYEPCAQNSTTQAPL